MVKIVIAVTITVLWGRIRNLNFSALKFPEYKIEQTCSKTSANFVDRPVRVERRDRIRSPHRLAFSASSGSDQFNSRKETITVQLLIWF